MRSCLASLLFALLAMAAACSQNSADMPSPKAQQAPQASANAALAGDVRNAVVAATGYEASAVDVTIGSAQVVVTISDSKLLAADHAARDAEAATVSAAVARVIESPGAASAIQAIHIDYAKRNAGSAATIIDAIDFRKNPEGRFAKDIT
jgi:hypothetical protein